MMNDYQKFWLEFARMYGTARAQYVENLFWELELRKHWENYFQLEFPRTVAHNLKLLTGMEDTEKAIECFQLYSNSQILRHPGDRWNFDVQFRVDWWAL